MRTETENTMTSSTENSTTEATDATAWARERGEEVARKRTGGSAYLSAKGEIAWTSASP